VAETLGGLSLGRPATSVVKLQLLHYLGTDYWSADTMSFGTKIPKPNRNVTTERFVPVSGQVAVVRTMTMPNGQTVRTVRKDTLAKALAGYTLRQTNKKK
jgi:hypothetical protein